MKRGAGGGDVGTEISGAIDKTSMNQKTQGGCRPIKPCRTARHENAWRRLKGLSNSVGEQNASPLFPRLYTVD